MIMTEIYDLFHMDAGQVLPDKEKMCYLQTESAFFFACDLNSVHQLRVSLVSQLGQFFSVK